MELSEPDAEAEDIEELRAEVRELRGLVDAYGNQLAHIRRVIAGSDDGFWNIKEPESGESLLARIEVAEGKMEGFAQRLQAVKREVSEEEWP